MPSAESLPAKRWRDMTEEERAGIDMAAKIGLTIEFNTYHSKTYYSTWIKANEYRFPEHCYRIKPNDEQT